MPFDRPVAKTLAASFFELLFKSPTRGPQGRHCSENGVTNSILTVPW